MPLSSSLNFLSHYLSVFFFITLGSEPLSISCYGQWAMLSLQFYIKKFTHFLLSILHVITDLFVS